MSQTPPASPALAPGSGLVLVVGNLTIDDVVLPTGETRMGTLGGNSVHAATAVVTAGARAALIARRGEDFPPGALAALADAGVDVGGLVGIAGPTVRNWVVYEEDGSRHWLYRTPPERSAQVAPQPEDLPEAALRQAGVVHVAAMPLGHAERLVARVRQVAPDVVITLDTHETWDDTVADRVLALARTVSLFVPSREELTQLTGAASPADGLAALAAAGVASAVVKAGGAGAYLLADGRITHIPALDVQVADATGAGRRVLRRSRCRSRARTAGAGRGRPRRGRGRDRDHRERQPPAARARPRSGRHRRGGRAARRGEHRCRAGGGAAARRSG